MKHLILLMMLALCATAINAQQTDPKEPVDLVEEAENLAVGPVLTLESTVVDYGEIEQGSDPVRKVNFTNTGTEPLIISNAKGSCGCTVPTWPREPIGPGETSEIQIRYDTKRLGAINKTVKLTTNDSKGQYVIRVTGHISPKAAEEGLPEKEGIFGKQNNN